VPYGFRPSGEQRCGGHSETSRGYVLFVRGRREGGHDDGRPGRDGATLREARSLTPTPHTRKVEGEDKHGVWECIEVHATYVWSPWRPLAAVLWVLFSLVSLTLALMLGRWIASPAPAAVALELAPSSVGHSVYFDGGPALNWSRAVRSCEAQARVLAAPTTVAERDALETFLEGFDPAAEFWLGIADTARNGTWATHAGSAVPPWVQKWRAAEPSRGMESCVVTSAQTTARPGHDGGRFHWNNVLCEQAFRFVCEQPAPTMCVDHALVGTGCIWFNTPRTHELAPTEGGCTPQLHHHRSPQSPPPPLQSSRLASEPEAAANEGSRPRGQCSERWGG
jgi:hypothetical protein